MLSGRAARDGESAYGPDAVSKIGGICDKLREACVVMVDEARVRERVEKYTGVCVASLHSFWKALAVSLLSRPEE